jgi:hypothetical protein
MRMISLQLLVFESPKFCNRGPALCCRSSLAMCDVKLKIIKAYKMVPRFGGWFCLRIHARESGTTAPFLLVRIGFV